MQQNTKRDESQFIELTYSPEMQAAISRALAGRSPSNEPPTPPPGVLSPDDPDDPECCDYTLNGNSNSCWILVGGLSVYILRDGDGVRVMVYPDGEETEDELASLSASPETDTEE